MATTSDPILITGCSTGMGREAALALLNRGHTVYATARRPETLDDLAEAGAHVLALDVTDEDSMHAAVDLIEKEHGAVGTLINNAGYSQPGPLETVEPAQARRQFDTNVFGLMRLTQMVLPAMREAQRGRIINISSMGGRMALPNNGWYHSTKYALEALSDALRMEVRPFGIRVVLIEPGPIKTDFDSTSSAHAAHDPESPYATLEANHAELFATAYGGPAASARSGARTYVKAVEARRPRHRYPNTVSGRAMIYLRHFLGSRVWDAAVTRSYRWR